MTTGHEICQTPHEDLCESALADYDRVSKEASHWNSLIPRAIRFYRDYGKPIPEKDDRAKICDIISEMLDNPKEGIYPTTRAYDKLEMLISSTRTEEMERIVKIIRRVDDLLSAIQEEK